MQNLTKRTPLIYSSHGIVLGYANEGVLIDAIHFDCMNIVWLCRVVLRLRSCNCCVCFDCKDWNGLKRFFNMPCERTIRNTKNSTMMIFGFFRREQMKRAKLNWLTESQMALVVLHSELSVLVLTYS